MHFLSAFPLSLRSIPSHSAHASFDVSAPQISVRLCPSRMTSPSSSLYFCVRMPSPLGQALDRLVTVSCTRYRASTSVLSTSCSSRGLRLATGDLILRGASRLDAFSVYPVRTWLLCRAFGNTTDPPAVRPPRSSRTKGSSSQISCARAG